MSNGTNVFYMEVAVFLEGVQVPCSSATVSYGLHSPPSCTIVLPASNIIRDLPETTKIHIFFKDLIADSSGEHKWRLLFDGELASWQYTTDANGAYMSITGLHSTAYLTLIQLLTLEASQYAFNPSSVILGNATLAMVLGKQRVQTKIIQNILNKKGYTTMAQIVAELLNAVIEETTTTATGKYYKSKLGAVPKGWKILKRIYNGGINAVASNGTSGTSGAGGDNNVPAYSGTFIWPTDTHDITSPFGPRIAPLPGASEYHGGIDIGAIMGSSVKATEGGIIVYADVLDGYGNCIQIKHKDGFISLYGHLNSFAPWITDGVAVSQGQVIGEVGNTGNSTGPHLHFEIRKDDTPVNPVPYLDGTAAKINLNNPGDLRSIKEVP